MFVMFDASGIITGTISGPGKDYGDILTRDNHTWLFYEGATTLDIRTSCVDVATRSVMPCSVIELVVDKLTLIADGIDVATITGIPVGSNVTVLCNGQPYGQHLANDETLEFAADDAAEYRIVVTCPKYISTAITLVASRPLVSLNVPDYSKVLA